MALVDGLAQRDPKAAGAPVAGADEAGELAPLGRAMLVQRLRDGLDLPVEVARVIGFRGGHPRGHGARGRPRSKAPQPFALVGLTARDPGAHALFELALAALVLGRLGALSLDVLGGLAGVLALVGYSAVLGRLGQLLGGQSELLVLAAFALARLGSCLIVFCAPLVRPPSGLVHRCPFLVHPHPRMRHLPQRVSAPVVGLGPGLLGRCLLFPRSGALGRRLRQLLVAGRLPLVGRAERFGALLVALGALLGRAGSVARRFVARLHVGTLVARGGALVEGVGVQLGDLGQALLNLCPASRTVLLVRRPGMELVDRRTVLGRARPRLLGVAARSQRLLAPGTGLFFGLISLLAGGWAAVLGLLDGQRLGDVLELGLLRGHAEEDLGNPTDRHHCGADEERQLDLAARPAPDQVCE